MFMIYFYFYYTIQEPLQAAFVLSLCSLIGLEVCCYVFKSESYLFVEILHCLVWNVTFYTLQRM